ncbi:hypothetical protein C8R47DRAFT_1192522 [Mycena vitilis]|nr:hypothetical protein C8R47DRAFT_1192522 [Mycena vitilis]
MYGQRGHYGTSKVRISHLRVWTAVLSIRAKIHISACIMNRVSVDSTHLAAGRGPGASNIRKYRNGAADIVPTCDSPTERTLELPAVPDSEPEERCGYGTGRWRFEPKNAAINLPIWERDMRRNFKSGQTIATGANEIVPQALFRKTQVKKYTRLKISEE